MRILRISIACTALLAVGCHSNEGVVLDLTVQLACPGDGASLQNLTVDVLAMPAASLAGGGTSFSESDRALFAEPARSIRRVLLLPAATRHVDVTATATLGSSTEMALASYDFDGASVKTDTLVLHGNCPSPVNGVDMASTDLAGQPSVKVAGALGDPYEAEGAEAPSANYGVAVLIDKGTGDKFAIGETVSSSYGPLTVGAVYVSGNGATIATSFKLGVDNALATGATRLVDVAVGTRTPAQFTLKGLDELTLAAGGTRTLTFATAQPMFFSTVNMAANATLTISGAAPGFLWVPGLVTAGIVNSTAARFPGCAATACNAATSGPGFGGGSSSGGNSGGGAGYATDGSPGSGTTVGKAYGEPSVIGLPGGSGGGAGNAGAAAGGAGGGALRIRAGRIAITGAIQSDGGTGGSALLLAGSGGGGSGGTLLLQAENGVTGGSVFARGGAAGSAATGPAGGAGAAGRTRVDVGLSQTFSSTFTPAVGFVGAMIAADWPAAFGPVPTTVKVVCGGTAKYQLFLDGNSASAPLTCTASAGAVAIADVPFSTAPSAAMIHQACVKIFPVSGTTPARYANALAEDLSCRSFAVAGP